MCLITFAYHQHPKYKLILAANRDEAYSRPTRGADFWPEHPEILAGKDLKAGGTWMGINRSGHFAAITNYRDPEISKPDPPSRGHLVLDYLIDSDAPLPYLRQKSQGADRYMGFNLLVGTPREIGYYSNQLPGVHSLTPGLYGLSNRFLDTPWPKIERSKKNLRELIEEENVSEQTLFELLADDRKAPGDQLPDTGLPTEIEKKLSPVFIRTEEYGTRCSTILLVDQNDNVTFVERRFRDGTLEVTEENRFFFSIEYQSQTI